MRTVILLGCLFIAFSINPEWGADKASMLSWIMTAALFVDLSVTLLKYKDK